MKKVAIIVVSLLIVVYFGAGYYFSGLIINGGSRGYDEAAEIERLAETGISNLPEREAVMIQSGEITLAGSFYEHPNDGNCAIILLHGRGGTRVSTMPYVPLFWDLNCDVLAYDLRGSGESSEAYQTFGYYDRFDADTAVDWLADRSSIPPSQIGILGGSYGSAVALETLAVRSDLAFVVADSTFSSLSSIVAEQGSGMFGSWVTAFVPGALFISGVRADFNASEVSAEDAVINSTTPILLIHGSEDEVNGVENSEAVYANSNKETTVLEITEWGPGHVASLHHDYEAYAEIVYSFIDTYAPNYSSGNN